MRLLLLHPELPTCGVCQRFLVVDIKTGEIHRNRLTNEPTPRPAGSLTPCDACPKCAHLAAADRNPASGKLSDLSDKNRKTVELYHQHCAAPLPVVDAVIRQNFGVLHELFDEFDRHQRRSTAAALDAILSLRLR